MTYKLVLAASAACLALAACNTSSGSSSSLTSAQAQNVDATYADYQDRIVNDDLTTVTPQGQATMSGYMGVGGINPEDDTTVALGELTMNVDFDGGTLTGTADNFGIYSGDPLVKDTGVTGSLDVAGTVSGSGLDANASGHMSDGSGTGADFDLTMSGSFYDDAGTLTTVGDLTGTMDESGTKTEVSGGFYATAN